MPDPAMLCARYLFGFILLSALAQHLVSPVGAQQPQISRIETQQFSAGKRTSLSVHGKVLDNPIALWTPFARFPVDTATEKPTSTKVMFQGVVPESVVPGVYESRLLCQHAVSSRRYVIVDDLPSFELSDLCETRPPAAEIPVGSCVEGSLNPLKPRFFGLHLKQGQTVSVEVFARRLESLLDPVLILTDEAGREMAFADDTPGLAGDAQLRVTAPVDARYVLELRDVAFAGGDSHFFHLRVGDFPLIQGTIPRRISQDQPTRAIGSDLPVVARWPSEDKANDTGSVIPVTVAGSLGSSITAAVGGPTGVVLEEQLHSNNSMSEATRLKELPVSVGGLLEQPGDEDWYQFSIDAPQQLCVSSYTGIVGAPTDLLLELRDHDGRLMQSMDDSGSRDAQLSLALPKAGDYFLCIKEVSQQGGPAFTYDLDIEFGGAVDVTTVVDVVPIPQGGTVAVPVELTRHGNVGAVSLQASRLPAGITSAPVYVGARQKSASIVLQSSGDAADVFHGYAELLADAEILMADKTEVRRYRVQHPSSPATETNVPLARVTSGIFCHSSPAAEFALSSELTTVDAIPGSELSISITAVRGEEWTQPIELSSMISGEELPEGITISGTTMEKSSSIVTVTIAENAVPGRYSLSLQGTLKKEKTAVVHPVPTITLIVKRPSM